MGRIKTFAKSFYYAIRGLSYVLRNERNFQNEVGASIVVIVAMIYFKVTESEMIVLFLVIMGVLVMEIFNTVVERVVDMLKPRVHPYVKVIKDMMAASVLVTSLLALIIGIIIFTPHVMSKF